MGGGEEGEERGGRGGKPVGESEGAGSRGDEGVAARAGVAEARGDLLLAPPDEEEEKSEEEGAEADALDDFGLDLRRRVPDDDALGGDGATRTSGDDLVDLLRRWSLPEILTGHSLWRTVL